MIKNLAIGGRSNRALLVLALLLGGLAAVLTVVYLSRAEKGDGGGGGGGGVAQPAVVAAQDIPAGTRVTAGMVAVKELPVDSLLPGVFGKTEDAVGLVTQVRILQGEQMVSSRLTQSDVELSQFKGDLPLSLAIPQGRRAFSLLVSQVAAAGGLVRPGDYVDVIMSDEFVVSPDSGQTVGQACYVMQDLLVLAVSQSTVKAPVQSGETAPQVGSTDNDPDATSATLAVTPQEALTLAAAQRGVDGDAVRNQLWIAVRPFGERGAAADAPPCTQAAR